MEEEKEEEIFLIDDSKKSFHESTDLSYAKSQNSNNTRKELLISRLNVENELLQKQCSEMNQSIINTCKRHRDTNLAITKQLELSVEKEKNLTTSLENFKKDIDTYKTIINELKTKNDLCNPCKLKNSIFVDLEAQYTCRIFKLEEEIELWKQKFFDSKKDLENCQVQFALFKDVSEKKITTLKEFESSASNATTIIPTFINESMKHFDLKTDKIKNLETKLKKLTTIEMHLREENKKLKLGRDEIEENLKDQESRLSSDISVLKGELVKSNNHVRKLEHKFDEAEKENRYLQERLLEINRVCDREKSAARTLNCKISEERLRVGSARQHEQHEFEKERIMFDTEKQHLVGKIKELQEKLRSYEDKIVIMQRQYVENSKNMFQSESQIRKDAQSAITHLQQTNESLSRKNSTLGDTILKMVSKHDTILRNVQRENSSVFVDFDRVSKEKESLIHQLVRLKTDADKMQHKLQECEREVDLKTSQIEILTTEVSELEEKYRDATYSVTALNEDLRKEQETSQRLREKFHEALSKKEYTKESLQSQIKENNLVAKLSCEKKVETQQKKLSREKTKNIAYKQKCVSMHRTVDQLKRVIHDLTSKGVDFDNDKSNYFKAGIQSNH